ncbi:hypothetical protein SAMN05421663_102181 [Terribacillus halophilus]|uniref:tRNA-Val4 n=2 Tax=Terribacillus halophilus TaxID=361279 RepID=A0A1G6KXT0_9BACI|nr:hypothetical protein SAMN05421663_102181 [Terribacillus halophilus]
MLAHLSSVQIDYVVVLNTSRLWRSEIVKIMKYSYEFKKDPFGITRIKLSEELSVFSDVFEDISTEEEADEYVGYVKKVLDGEYQDFEITLNATSVSIKKDLTIAKHHYRIDEPFESTIETEGFLELMLIWKEKIAGIFGD